MPTALLLIDIQHDFLPPSGALAVPDGESILPIVHRLLDEKEWDLVVASQDYHPAGHVSFASTHALAPFTSTSVVDPRTGRDKLQELWPEHCVQGTRGCEIEEGVQARLEERGRRGGRVEIVRKGVDEDLDAYSAFDAPLSHAPSGPSPLTHLLLDARITTLLLCGLATDFCVRASALSALSDPGAPWHPAQGGRVLLMREGVRGVFPGREGEVLAELEGKGARVVSVEGEEVRALLAGRWRREGEA